MTRHDDGQKRRHRALQNFGRARDSFVLAGMRAGREENRPVFQARGAVPRPRGRRPAAAARRISDCRRRWCLRTPSCLRRLAKRQFCVSTRSNREKTGLDKARQPRPSLGRAGRHAAVDEHERDFPVARLDDQVRPDFGFGEEGEVGTPMLDEAPAEARAVQRHELMDRALGQAARRRFSPT